MAINHIGFLQDFLWAPPAACLRGRQHVHGHAAVGGRVDQGSGGGENAAKGNLMRKWGGNKGATSSGDIHGNQGGRVQNLFQNKEFFYQKYQSNGQVCNYDVIIWSRIKFCDVSLSIQVCPKKGINPTILLWGWDWDHQTYSREGYGCLGFYHCFDSVISPHITMSGN